MGEVMALIKEFGAVLQPGAVVGIAAAVVLFLLGKGPPAPQQAGGEGGRPGPRGDGQAGEILG